MSEEDKQLKEELDMLVERLMEPDQTLYKPALESLRTLIRSSTTSMTSVPKPLKFLRFHYDTLKEIYTKIGSKEVQQFCADVVSVLGMVCSESRECLKYIMLGSREEIGSWGHEYVRHLTSEITTEWQELEEGDNKREPLEKMIEEIVPYLMGHNAEPEACDFLMEVEKIEDIPKFVEERAFPKVCLYLKSCVAYVPEPENTTLLKTAMLIYRNFSRFPDALLCAVQLNDMESIKDIFLSCKDSVMQKQMAYMLGRQQVFLELDDEMEDFDDLTEIMSNAHLNNNFTALARELDIMEPKTPEDIFKTHLEPSHTSSKATVDSARQNLASSFVNGFVNAGFGQDKLLTDDGNKWLYKNKEHGMLSATASLGLILLWDVDGGLTQIDKYLYSTEDYIKSGALLATGIVNSGVKNECDPALALLSDYVTNKSNVMRLGSVVGLGLAYAGSNREDVISLLLTVIADSSSSMEVQSMAALACGMIAVASCNDDVTSTLLQTLMEKSEADLKDSYTKFIVLGLALTYFGKQEDVETIIAALEVIPEPFRSMSITLVNICAYAGTGNVLKVQELLHICSEHYNTKETSKDKKDDKDKNDQSKEKKVEEEETSVDLSAQQSVAVIGLALIAMGEDVGSEMCFRSLGHLMRYGEPVIRRSVPLALALMSASNPKLNILDTLSKFSHDNDAVVAHNAILALGIVGAGTNNARLAQMLRQLAVYHAKDADNLFCVRIAQGLCHMGKGTLTVCPYHSDRQILSPVACAGLLAVLTGCLDTKNIILGKSHYILFHLVSAIQPRMLVTFDEELRPLPVSVRVGKAVDVVGQAGKPKTITGFQTHTTPVLLAHGERAELATNEYISLTPLMEGVAILRKNPDYMDFE